MKKKSFFTFLALSLSGVLLGDNTPTKDAPKPSDPQKDPAYGNAGYHLMTEDELMLELDETGIKTFQQLSAEGKKLALEVASARCNGTNKCEALNACADDNHTCAGKGKCEGLGKCSFSDKNLAVKLVSEKMAKKRADLNK